MDAKEKMKITKERSDELWKKAELDIGAREEYLEDLIKDGKSGFSGYEYIYYYPGVLDLVNELVDIEDIPEELMKKISVVLGERWLRDYEMDNK